MADRMFAPQPGRKRSFEPDSGEGRPNEPSEKRSRHTTGDGQDGWLTDSATVGVTTPARGFQQPNHDSDSQSSMVSEPGSPQSLSAAGSDDMDMDTDEPRTAAAALRSTARDGSPWRRGGQQRVATPFLPRRAGPRAVQLRTGASTQTHVRDRHPQEAGAPDRLDVPSPIDEDEVPTPPSAADAAGSQLSMLSVSDVDMDEAAAAAAADLPTISVDSSHTLPLNEDVIVDSDREGNPPARGPEIIIVRKQRQRSGALSSPSGTPAPDTGLGGSRRGLHMGFRADCEKCRLRVPGHMNHFLA